MKKLITTMALLCFPFGAYAQDQEVWACQQEESAGLFWQNNSWVSARVNPQTLLVTIPAAPPRHSPNAITDNRNNGTYKLGDDSDSEMFCRTNFNMSVACLNQTGSRFLLLDRETGRLGFATLRGAISMSSDYRDTVASMIYNCTKF